MLIETLAAVGGFSIIVSAVKGITGKPYEDIINNTISSVKKHLAPHQVVYLEEFQDFLPGLELIVKNYSSLPFELTGRYQGTTGIFDFYQFQMIPKAPLSVIEKATYNLAYKVLITAFKSFLLFVFSGAPNQNGEVIITIYYAIDSDGIKGLKDWYLRQINFKKNAVVSPQVIDTDLLKELQDHDC